MVPEENNSLVVQAENNTELNANAEFRGNKEDEEDVLLTAQRYLNIFHQIHIFKEFRQKQFRQQLLEIPHEIRKVIALLPGGRVLLEHIAEIMEKDGKKDPELEALLLSLAQNDHFSDNKLSPNPTAAPALAAPTVTVAAPQSIEIGGNFTDALKESFQSYSQNLKDLSENIQKIAANNKASGTSGNSAADSEYTKALTDSFKAYSQDLKDLTESIKQMAQNQHSAAMPTSVEISDNVAKTITSSFDSYARNLEDLTQSIKQIASNQQAPAAPAAATIELGGDFSKAITASFEAYSHNLENLTESIKQIASNNATQIPLAAPQEAVALPNLTDSISAVLKESAQQQMDVLKSFGEMLSKTIADSQKELVSSIKNSNQNSMIFGKFMQVPVDATAEQNNNAIAYVQTAENNPQIVENQASSANLLPQNQPQNIKKPQPNFATTPQKAPVKEPVAAPQKTVIKEQPKPKVEPKAEPKIMPKVEPKVEKKAEPKLEQRIMPQVEPKVEPKKEEKSKPVEKVAPTVDKTPEKAKIAEPKKQPATDVTDDIALALTGHNSKPQAPAHDLGPNEIDINDAFKQIENSLHESTPPAKKTDKSTNTSENILAEAFATPSADTSPADDIDFAAEYLKPEEPKAKAKEAIDPIAQIRDALDSNSQFSLDNFDDMTPVSLSPTDDLQDAFSASPAASDSAYTDNSAANDAQEDEWEYVDENGNPIDASDDGEWEYEYVDEDGNPSEQADDNTEYEYVDEDGNPIEPSDDNTEYEYVDENGNPIDPSDDDTEYEYVDEDGNPIDPSDDEEWEYEYIDEDGNPIKG